MNPFRARVGNTGEVQEFRHLSRSKEQFEVVRKISERSDFDFFTIGSEMFEEGIKYTGPVSVMWYGKDALVLTRVGKSGKILRELKDKLIK